MEDSNEARAGGSAPQIIDREKLYLPGDPHPHLVMTPAELRTAIRVWLTVAPRRIWEPFEKQLTAELDPRRPARRSREDMVDPRHLLADYIVAKFAQCGWRPTHEEPGPAFNTPHWEREGAEIPVLGVPDEN